MPSSNQEKVLLVEDNLVIQQIVISVIGPLCDLTCVPTIAEASEKIKSTNFALVILDVVLPDGDGFSFCKSIKSNDIFLDLPVIFLTGQSDIDDRVQGFTLGAEDYIVKPIEPKEFRARVMSKLNRRPKSELQPHLRRANFHADLVLQKISVDRDGKKEELNLTPIEFKLLVHFLQNEGKIFNRRELVNLIWGTSVHVSDHTVDTHISTLRKKIGESAGYIKAVLRKGYCFSSESEPS